MKHPAYWTSAERDQFAEKCLRLACLSEGDTQDALREACAQITFLNNRLGLVRKAVEQIQEL